MATEAQFTGVSTPPAHSCCIREGGEPPRIILLVEDEAQVRTAISLFLRHQGFQVLEAADGAEAFRVSRPYWGRLCLLLTDMVLPGMSGTRLAAQIRLAFPRLKVLFMSGYPEEELDRKGIEPGESSFIQSRSRRGASPTPSGRCSARTMRTSRPAKRLWLFRLDHLTPIGAEPMADFGERPRKTLSQALGSLTSIGGQVVPTPAVHAGNCQIPVVLGEEVPDRLKHLIVGHGVAWVGNVGDKAREVAKVVGTQRALRTVMALLVPDFVLDDRDQKVHKLAFVLHVEAPPAHRWRYPQRVWK